MKPLKRSSLENRHGTEGQKPSKLRKNPFKLYLLFAFLLIKQFVAPQALAHDDETGTPTTLTGELTVVQACDFINHRQERFYLLDDTASGKTYKLKFNKKAPERLRSGLKVKVKGLARDSELVLPANGGEIQTLEAPAVTVTGEQRTIVIGINFSDAALDCSAATIHGIMFSGAQSVAGLYQETSNGNVWLTGDVVGPFTINYSRAGACDFYGWAAAADAAAQAQGVNLAQYNRRLYVIPRANSCGWAGLGTIGGNPSRAWVAHCSLADVYAHELGHNLTLHHASTDTNNDGVSDCEYCDTSDFMGYGGVGLRQLNAPHKDQLGWLPFGKAVTATANTTVTLAPLELYPQDTPYPQLLKIAKPNSSDFYYFSYRRRLGYDAALHWQYADRVNVHRYKGSGVSPTYFITALGDGGVFQDPATGFTVTHLYRNSDYATVQVTFNCSPTQPATALTPSTQTTQPGGALLYTVSLTNRDSSLCAPTTFYLAPTVPSGWTASVSPDSLTLPPGQSGNAVVSVRSPLVTANGTYAITVNVSDRFNTAHSVSLNANYVVDATAVPGPKDLSGRPARKRVRLTWKPPTGQTGLRAYAVWRDGVRIAETAKTRYRDLAVQYGRTYVYTVTALYEDGHSSIPSNAAAVTLPGY